MEMKLAENIRAFRKRQGLAQALESARRYDGILVIKDGRVNECGSFDELMRQNGYFHALFTVAQ